MEAPIGVDNSFFNPEMPHKNFIVVRIKRLADSTPNMVLYTLP